MKDETYFCKCAGGARGHVSSCPNRETTEPSQALEHPYRIPGRALTPLDTETTATQLTDAMAKLNAMQDALRAVPELAAVIAPLAQTVQQAIAVREAEMRDAAADAKFRIVGDTDKRLAFLEAWRSWAMKRFGVFCRDGGGIDNEGYAILTPYGVERLKAFDVKNTEPRSG